MRRTEWFLLAGVIVLAAIVVRAMRSAGSVVFIPTDGNTLRATTPEGTPYAPFYGPDVDPFLGTYTGSVL